MGGSSYFVGVSVGVLLVAVVFLPLIMRGVRAWWRMLSPHAEIPAAVGLEPEPKQRAGPQAIDPAVFTEGFRMLADMIDKQTAITASMNSYLKRTLREVSGVAVNEDEELIERARQYKEQHPELNFEEALFRVRQANLYKSL